ncbi:MAG TPA: hypothetical protein VMM79_18210, partial [Longimicrobiales bacterium]|nr:hypothetical protein [Longimicrobiales bacterium]
MTKEKARDNFLEGRSALLRLGGYRGTVTIGVTVSGLVRVRVASTRKQITLGPDSRAERAFAIAVAENALRRLGSEETTNRPAGPDIAGTELLEPLTVRQIWDNYTESLLGRHPDDLLMWGKRRLETYLKSLPQNARRDAPSMDSIDTIILAARRMDRDGVAKLDSDIAAMQPGHLTRWMKTQLAAGASPHTIATYFGRFRTAIRAYTKAWPDAWGSRRDPTLNVTPPSTKHVAPPEIGEEHAKRLHETLRRRGEWRTLATTMIALETGRRVGAISGSRPGLHLDAPPLCDRDFSVSRDGIREVTWRANAAKGGAFGAGDVVIPCTRQLAIVHRWLRRFHPNPLGPSQPLIWDADDPSRAATYDALSRAVTEAWPAAFLEPKPHGLGFHSYCRTVITTLGDEAGIQAAAEFTGRSVETAAKIYKRQRQTKHRETA